MLLAIARFLDNLIWGETTVITIVETTIHRPMRRYDDGVFREVIDDFSPRSLIG